MAEALCPDSMEIAQWARPFETAMLRDVVRRRDALPHLAPTVLLHAGPPLDGRLPEPVRNASIQALLYEGLAADEATARALLATRAVELQPAQDHGVATPLAQVVSASMPLVAVGSSQSVRWAPLIEGPAPALRFGTVDAQARERLAAMADFGLARLGPLLRAAPVALHPVVLHALAQGDECHARTGAANEALACAIGGLVEEERSMLRSNPGFTLPILMAAALWRLQQQTTGLAACGGNGVEFGFRLHGDTRWHTQAATPPVGTRFAGHDDTAALGAIGDSAVVDFCGLGGQAIAAAPALCEEWQSALPPLLRAQRRAVVDPATGLVDPARVAASGVSPLVNLAVMDGAGKAGLIGRGVYRPGAALFGLAPEAATP